MAKIPHQFPNTMSATFVEEQAKIMIDTFKTLAIILFIIQLCLRGSLEQLVSLYFALQLIVYLSIYTITQSIFAQVYMDELRKVLEFYIVEPSVM